MTPFASVRAFPARISHSLTLALGIVLAVVLLVGAISVTLAIGIYRSVDASAQEFGRIRKLEQVHSVFDDLIFELQQIDSTRQLDHAAVALLMQEDIARQLEALGETNRGQGGSADRGQAVLGDLRRFSEEALAVTKHLAATGHLARTDQEWLNRATHEVPRLTEELAGVHEFRIARLHERSQYLVQGIVVLFVGFTVIGAAFVVVARFAASRGIAAPLRRLAAAAEQIARGSLETRVPVRQTNEIGLLAQSFNTMADRLQQHEREMRNARDALDEKVRAVRALYQIGTEIARLRQLDRILQSVVDRARELLHGDAAALCIAGPKGGDHVTSATSGPPEAFRPDSEVKCERQAAEAPGPDGTAKSAIYPEYLRGNVTAFLRLENDLMGTIQVGTRVERAFTADETELLFGLATQAAIAIERAKLLEEARNLAVVQERERLARELHDSLAQVLGLLCLKLKSALERPGDAQVIAEELREMVQIADYGYQELRQSIFGLRTCVSRGLGLVPTLTEYLHEFSAQTGIAVALEVADEPMRPLPLASEVQAVRIIQEALANVRKHAGADQARVRLQRDGAWVGVAIEDNGAGWDPRTVRDPLHFGLQTMRERAESLGGRLEIDTAPGRGTRVVATLPGGPA